MFNASNSTRTILLATVGMQQPGSALNRFLDSLVQSISKHVWNRVVLLPTRLSSSLAKMIAEKFTDLAVEVLEPSEAIHHDRFDESLCYFESTIGDLFNRGIPCEDIVVDAGPGTSNTVSAALLMAAIRKGISRLKMEEQGQVTGHEFVVADATRGNLEIGLVQTESDFIQRAHYLLTMANPAAVLRLKDQYSQIVSKNTTSADACKQVWNIARFAAAWDRFDYESAVLVPTILANRLPSVWVPFAPSQEHRSWVRKLAEERKATCHSARAVAMRHILVDVLANGYRRLRQMQFEDALIRAYRVVDLLCTARLLDHKISGVHGQFEMISRLRSLCDSMSGQLQHASRHGLVSAKDRNDSVLIHGLKAQAGTNVNSLMDLYGHLESIVRTDRSNAAYDLQICRWLEFSS